MLAAIHKIAFVLACLARAGDARRSKTSTLLLHNNQLTRIQKSLTSADPVSDAQPVAVSKMLRAVRGKRVLTPLKVLALFLLALNPPIAFNPSFARRAFTARNNKIAGSSRIHFGRSPFRSPEMTSGTDDREQVAEESQVPKQVAGVVVLTREAGKNDKLRAALEPHGIRCVEVPMVETRPGPQRGQLVDAIRAADWAYVVVTSPEAAAVLLEAWTDAGKPPLRTAAVGKGTADILGDALPPVFMPSKATGAVLADELPLPTNEGESFRVLYPCSLKAGQDVQQGLSSRGFEVTRLNTYSTEPVKTVSEELKEDAGSAGVVTFGSPSTLKAWVEIMGAGPLENGDIGVACIGETSGELANKRGFARVSFPEKPGIAGWAESVLELFSQKVQ